MKTRCENVCKNEHKLGENLWKRNGWITRNKSIDESAHKTRLKTGHKRGLKSISKTRCNIGENHGKKRM